MIDKVIYRRSELSIYVVYFGRAGNQAHRQFNLSVLQAGTRQRTFKQFLDGP